MGSAVPDLCKAAVGSHPFPTLVLESSRVARLVAIRNRMLGYGLPNRGRRADPRITAACRFEPYRLAHFDMLII